MLGIETTTYEIKRVEDIQAAFATLRGQADALYIAESAFIGANGAQIISLANNAQMPTVGTTADGARVGILMSYGANYPSLFRRCADLVDKILRGAQVGDLPVEQPTKFDLVVNLKTAKALNITIPDQILAIADEVIE